MTVRATLTGRVHRRSKLEGVLLGFDRIQDLDGVLFEGYESHKSAQVAASDLILGTGI